MEEHSSGNKQSFCQYDVQFSKLVLNVPEEIKGVNLRVISESFTHEITNYLLSENT